MIQEDLSGVRVITVANEKGGSGKSTVAIHLAVALLRAGQSVGTIDLDARQRTFTRYIGNRLEWSRQCGKELPVPQHICIEDESEFSTAEAHTALAGRLERLAADHSVIIIDTPGHNHNLTRFAHVAADTLITPLNDSFVDLDVLANVDPANFGVTGLSHYARIVEEARHDRDSAGKPETDWIVLRNRVSTTRSRNKRFVGDALQDLAQKLRFRLIDGLAERVIFREFFPRGLTAVDDLEELTFGVRPTLSHATAQLEVQQLVAALLGASSEGAAIADAA
jgi:chromosome partitioning protein